MSDKFYILIFIFLGFVASCKKDYPKDIPVWLKNEIRECKKNKDCCSCGSRCIQISEWEKGDSIIYVFEGKTYPQSYSFKDFSGNFYGASYCCCGCNPHTILLGFSEKRKIFVPKYEDYCGN